MNRYLGEQEASLLLGLILLSLLVVWAFGDVLAPFFIALVLAYLLHGPQSFLIKKGCPKLLAVIVTFLAFLGIATSASLFLVPLVLDEVGSAVADIPAMMQRGEELMSQLVASSSAYVGEEFISAAFAQLNQLLLTGGEQLLAFSLGRIPGLMTGLVYAALVLILVFFLLKDWSTMAQQARGFLPDRVMALTEVWREMDVQLANYLRGKALEILIVGAASYVVFLMFGLRYSLLLAVLVGFSVLIPYIGAFSVTVPVALVAVFQWGLSSTTFYLIAAYIILQILDGNLLVPLIFSEAVDLNPVIIILAILVFGGIWGVWGIFLAIPLATLIKALLRSWPVAQSDSS